MKGAPWWPKGPRGEEGEEMPSLFTCTFVRCVFPSCLALVLCFFPGVPVFISSEMPDKPFYNHPPGADYHIPRTGDPGNTQTHFPLLLWFCSQLSPHPQMHVQSGPLHLDGVLQKSCHQIVQVGIRLLIISQWEQQSGKFQFLRIVITPLNYTSHTGLRGVCSFLHASAWMTLLIAVFPTIFDGIYRGHMVPGPAQPNAGTVLWPCLRELLHYLQLSLHFSIYVFLAGAQLMEPL